MITVFVVPHTHWDREWYETAARFRQRLVPVLDEIVGVLSRDPAFSCFLLDGQAAMLDDYLAVRPEQRSTVTALAQAGRLLLGPWYVLADELLSSDESLVRNLLLGRRTAESLGGWLPLGYSPDAFGHPATFPTILSGFGIRHGILWRGYGGEPGQESDTFRWLGPDGSAVTIHHLPPSGYEVGSGLSANIEAIGQRWKDLAAVLAPRARSRVRMVTAGADHHAIIPELPQLLAKLATLVPDHEFRIASPLEYFEALPESLPAVQGELRFSYRYTWTLQGIHSTRARLKQTIAEGDRLLLRWAEPQIALTQGGGDEGRRALLRAAWRDHLLNHPHDSFGGCVTDPVARDIAQRAESVTVQARGLLVDVLHDRLAQNRAAARRARERWTSSLVLVNPRPTPFTGVVEATVTVFQKDVIVGAPTAPDRKLPKVRLPRLIGIDGQPVPMQVLDAYDAYERLDSSRDYPDQDHVRAFRVALLAKDLPALGTQRLSGADAHRGRAAEPRVKDSVWVTRKAICASWGEVGATSGPGFLLRGPEWFGSLAELVSERDEGDTYTFEPVKGDRPLTGEWSRPRAIWTGPLVAAVARDVIVGDRARVTVTARMDAGSQLVRLVVEGINLAGNHRLRMVFPRALELHPDQTVADMQYGPVTRTLDLHDLGEFSREWPATSAPMHRYVSARKRAKGLTVFTRGAFEYELREDGAIAVTLFRAVGDLSRGDLRARAGNAAWPVATPEAQELGWFRVELAVTLFGVTEGSSPAEWDEIERLAEEFHAPVAGLMLRYGIDVPELVHGPELSGAGLAFKALKPGENGTGVVVRCVNVTNQEVSGQWKWPTPVRAATLARLDESPIRELSLDGARREIRFTARAREVVTIAVEAQG